MNRSVVFVLVALLGPVNHPPGSGDRQVGLRFAQRDNFHPARNVELAGVGQRVGEIQQLPGLCGQLIGKVPGRLDIVTNRLGPPSLQ